MPSSSLSSSPTRANVCESASGGGGALRSRARTSAARGLPQHACQPENEQFDATGAPIAVCAAGQLPVTGCYAPTLRCADDAGFRTSGNQPLLNPRPIYWLDRAITPTSTTATRFDRGGFLDGARRKWGIDDPRTAEVLSLGLDHGVDENVAP